MKIIKRLARPFLPWEQLIDRLIWYIGYYCFPFSWARRRLIGRYCRYVGHNVDCHSSFRTHGGKNLYIQDNVKLASTICGCQADIFIGENVFFGHRVMLLTPHHDITLLGKARQETIYSQPIRIERDVWIASGAIVLGGVIIGEGAVVAAGALVNKDIPRFAIAAGVPAKVIGYVQEESKLTENG